MNVAISESAITKMQAVVVVVILIVGIAGAVYYMSTFGPTAGEEVTLIIGRTAGVGGAIAPIWTYSALEFTTNQIFEGLTGFEFGTTNLIPILATNLGETTDAKTWTYYLREGIKFHDGTEFNALAVKEHFDNCFLTEAGTTYMVTAVINKTEVVDDYTIRFDLNHPSSSFPMKLALYYSLIESPASVEQYGVEGINDHPIGTGPFKFVSQKVDIEVVLEANRDWWRLKPEIAGDAYLGADRIEVDRLIIKQFGDSSTLRFAIEKGEIDVALKQMNSLDYPDLLDDPNLVSYNTGALEREFYIVWCGNTSVFTTFQKKEMRQAFSYAIDYDAITNLVFGDLATKLASFLPPEWPDYKPSAEYRYDPVKAKSLIEEAGFETPVKCTLWWTDRYPSMRDVVTVIQDSAAEAGFDVDISNGVDYETLKEGRATDACEIALWGVYADYPHPEYFADYLLASWGRMGAYVDVHMTDMGDVSETIDGLVTEIATTPDLAERKAACHELQDLWAEYLPHVFLYRQDSYVFTRKNIKGLVVSPITPYTVYFHAVFRTQ